MMSKKRALVTSRSFVLASLVLLLGSAGCYTGTDRPAQGDDASTGSGGNTGGGSDTGSESSSGGDGAQDAVLERVGEAGMRRLTAAEYSATVRDLLGVEVDAAKLLPEDWRKPFDNDYTDQLASLALIEGAELLASDTAKLALSTAESRDAVVGCKPEGVTDLACLRAFLTTFGRRALRRPLTDEELDRYAGLIAEAGTSSDFYAAVDVALRALLQHPEFLYRVERGTPVDGVPGVFRLNDHEIATRLSYFIWGSAPSDLLLDLADAGELHTPAQITVTAEDMLADERAHRRVGRFHALWLGYEQLPHGPELSAAMQAETQALIDRVIFEDERPWQDLLRATETFVDASLATHYGFAPPPDAAGSQWVSYGETGRQGLLSHGTFLSAAARIDDSSPTKRGLLVRDRLLCTPIELPPPELMVDVDNAKPPDGMCKEKWYREEHAKGGCAGCHGLMDPIGLGLERYDNRGVYRTVEQDIPECEISGQGSLDGRPFSGPAELSDLLLETDGVNACVARQVYRFAVGRTRLGTFDEEFVSSVVDDLGSTGDIELKALILRIVGDEAFALRREENEEGE